MRHNEGQGKVQHAPDIVRASTTEPFRRNCDIAILLIFIHCPERVLLQQVGYTRYTIPYEPPPATAAIKAQQAGLGLPTRPEEQLNTRPLQGGIWMVSAGSRGTRAAPLASHSLAPHASAGVPVGLATTRKSSHGARAHGLDNVMSASRRTSR